MRISLQAVPVSVLGRYWAAIEPEVELIAARCGEPWKPVDVLAELRGNAATLCIAFEDAIAVGWVIHQIRANGYWKDLHIWLAGDSTLDRMKEFWPLLRVIRDGNGCKGITLESPRRWERALNFLEVRYLYREGI